MKILTQDCFQFLLSL